jgi:hypothetical protein
VVPELQNRGVYKEDYDPAPTLREKLFGGGRARLPEVHAGAQHRRNVPITQSGARSTVDA